MKPIILTALLFPSAPIQAQMHDHHAMGHKQRRRG
jgi:hypothetical protein